MAIYRCELKVYSRGKAHSATAASAYVTGSKVSGRGGNSGKVNVKSVSAVEAAAYRSSEKLHDVAADRVHDYSRKDNVLWSGIMAPADAPAWARDRSQLWNAVEAGEKRKDAQLFRECLVSIPRELSPEAGRKLVQDFVQAQFVSRGMVADIGIHSPRASDGGDNHHAHIMITMRDLKSNGTGFGNKRRDWNDVQWQGKGANTARQGGFLNQLREAWAAACNKALADAGDGTRVDHRSLKDQGIDRVPQQKLGKAKHATPEKRNPGSAERTAAWLSNVHGRAGDVRTNYHAIMCGRAAGRAFHRDSLHLGAEAALAAMMEDMEPATSTTTLHITGHGPGRPDHDLWGHDDGGPDVG